MNAIAGISAEDQKWSQVAATGTVSGQNRGYGTRTEWLQPAPNLLIRAGLGGRCCLLRVFDCSGFSGVVPPLSLICCATGRNCELVLIRFLSCA
jgi:hypothetical protein